MRRAGFDAETHDSPDEILQYHRCSGRGTSELLDLHDRCSGTGVCVDGERWQLQRFSWPPPRPTSASTTLNDREYANVHPRRTCDGEHRG